MIANTPEPLDCVGLLSIDPTAFHDVSGLAHDSRSQERDAFPSTVLEVHQTPLDIRSQAILADVVRKLNARWADPFE
jgi:hypothetical protein